MMPNLAINDLTVETQKYMLQDTYNAYIYLKSINNCAEIRSKFQPRYYRFARFDWDQVRRCEGHLGLVH